MESASITAATPIRYLLTSRLSAEGRVSIMLKLYRDQRVVAKPVATVEVDQTADVMRKCRRHLVSLGLQPLTRDMEVRSRPVPAGGLPPATRLFQTRRGSTA